MGTQARKPKGTPVGGQFARQHRAESTRQLNPNMSGNGGYDWTAGKSNRALEAEANGLRTASALAKSLKVSVSAVKSVLRPNEWHHASKFFNHVDYYNPEIVTDEELAAMQAITKQQKEQSAQVHKNCTVHWLEWSGSRRSPRATERKEDRCTVVIKGQTATIVTSTGKTFVKRLSTRGFSWTSQPNVS